MQVAQLGVLKAVERYDPEHGAAFPSFAMPTVMGELRRHFRDRTWSVGVPRRLKELHVSLARAVEHLGQTLGRQPKVEELASELGVSVDEILEALDAGAAYRAAPLSRPDDNDEEREPAALGEEDVGLADADIRLAARRLIATLPQRERTIVYLRFFGGLDPAGDRRAPRHEPGARVPPPAPVPGPAADRAGGRARRLRPRRHGAAASYGGGGRARWQPLPARGSGGQAHGSADGGVEQG